MTKEDLDAEIISLALSMDDEFVQQEETLETISELLCISHGRVYQAVMPDLVGG
jgi:hypothetical protein